MFQDRTEAGKLLAGRLLKYKDNKDTLVLGIPRGGIICAYEVAKTLHVLLDILVIKKIGFPSNEELALGAAGLNEFHINPNIAISPLVTPEYIAEQIRIKQTEVRKRYLFLRGKAKMPPVANKIIILVDDGLATGATAIMAVQILRKLNAKKIIVAVPVAPPETVQKLKRAADEVICIEQPAYFMAIGEFYRNFDQVEDEEAKKVLDDAKAWEQQQKANRKADSNPK